MTDLSDILENVRTEDYVEYFLFPTFDEGLSQEVVNKSLDSFLKQVNTLVQPRTQNYIWHKDEFQLLIRGPSHLPPVNKQEEKLPPHLYGVTHFGENIEDEWFIVHLISHITKSIPSLFARVIDSDGEFLLIEAADYLPKWASPEICDKRVYLVNGRVHIVPPQDEEEIITVTEGLNTIKSSPAETIASERVQASIAARINGYPDKVSELIHQANAYVPCAVAALLEAKPSLIAPAITAFCHRDHIDTRACRAMRYFPPETCVMARVKMTRCLYAMLVHHKYTPDRKTGWTMPQINMPDYNSHSIGVKLACGFEILVSHCKERGEKSDLDNDRDWLKYKKSLLNLGYFNDLLEGSAEYRRLEAEAKEYFKNNSMYSQPSSGQTILNLLDTIDYDIDEMRRRSLLLPPPDEETWMEMSSEDLDQMLTDRYGAPPEISTEDMPKHLSSFLERISSLKGVEHPKLSQSNEFVGGGSTSHSSGRAEDWNSESTTSGPIPPTRRKKKMRQPPQQNINRDDDNSNRVSFDPDSFSCAVNNILDFFVPEDKWDLESDESGMSDYEDETEMDLSRKKSMPGNNCELKQYMDQMDRELASTTLGQSFVKKQTIDNKGMEDSFSDIENFKPVDIDMNALANILKSYEEEMGGAGPASNLLGPMGIRLSNKKMKTSESGGSNNCSEKSN